MSKASPPSVQQQSPLEDCQLQVLYDGTTPLSRGDKLIALSLRLASALKCRVSQLQIRLAKMQQRMGYAGTDYHKTQVDTPVEAPTEVARNAEFKPGEIVRVRPIAEIRAMLNEPGRTHVMAFFEGMEKFCGQQLRVAKQVTTMFEPSLGRSIRLKNTYLLEGAHCDGRRMYAHEGCDRGCFYFWKSDWLEKIADGNDANKVIPEPTFPSRRFRFFGGLKPGDPIRVRSLAEINASLDSTRKTDGLQFMVGMEKFCGQRFYIKQQARFLLNEETNEMRHIKKAYTLDGVTCAGQGLTRQQQCDRACLYVWNDAWLEKL